MSRTPEYVKAGWRRHGPGGCKCPGCGAIVSTNALARARHVCPLRVGDVVISTEPGSTWRRKVLAIGDGEHLRGFVRVEGSIAWESARHFVKVTS